MSKKRTKNGDTDSRREPDPDGTPEAVTNYRVDRVFAPAPRIRESASQVATELLERRRSGTLPPPPFGPEGADTEVSLRRQLSRLQRQLAEAQRELANKDDEIASEVEKRLQTVSIHDGLLEAGHRMQSKLDELLAYQARTQGVEQRLQDSIATADELAHQIEVERAETLAIKKRIDELTISFDETRSLWNAERAMLEERSNAEIAQLEKQRKAAADAADAAVDAGTVRLREAHEAELVELRAAHERSLTALRGELEPKALEARNLTEERERLSSELTAVRNEMARESAEREEVYSRELAQTVEQYTAELATQARTHGGELARAIAERDEQVLASQQATRSGEAREQALQEAGDALREAQKKLQRELAEVRERCTGLEADRASLDERLTSATRIADALAEDNRRLVEQVQTASSEARRASLDRLRFVAYLEEGLALLGALPPTDPAQDPEITVSRTSTSDEPTGAS